MSIDVEVKARGQHPSILKGYGYMLNWLWVDLSLRGQKVGVQLLAEMKQCAADLGCFNILLDTLGCQANKWFLYISCFAALNLSIKEFRE